MKNKIILDIGATKIYYGEYDNKAIKNVIRKKTPKSLKEFEKVFIEINELSNRSSILNIALAGRTDKDGNVIFSPNLKLEGINLLKYFKNNFDKVNIANDVYCASLNLIYKEKVKNSILINWGSGIGGAIIINGNIYVGNGYAGEIGHISFGNKDIEQMIGGIYLKKNYGFTGESLYKSLKENNEQALNVLKKLGKKFGYFIKSMMYVFDPDSIYIIGGMTNLWPYLEKEVLNIGKTYNKNININVIYDNFYVFKGCYYLDE